LGDDAFWIPPRLWAYAADNQPDGDFSDYTDDEIASLIGYSKDASSMLQALLRSGFMDRDQKLHDWAEYNGFHKTFKARAKTAAVARWRKEKRKSTEEKRGEEASIPPSIASSIPEAQNGKPKKFVSELNAQILRAEQEIQRLRDFGRPEDRQKIIDLGKKKRQWREELFNQ
jgi:hypothetical protein